MESDWQLFHALVVVVVNSLQVIALAWIAGKQRTVKRDLDVRQAEEAGREDAPAGRPGRRRQGRR